LVVEKTSATRLHRLADAKWSKWDTIVVYCATKSQKSIKIGTYPFITAIIPDMNYKSVTSRLLVCVALTTLTALTACSLIQGPKGAEQTTPDNTPKIPAAPPRASLDYIETQGFDKNLAAALASDLPSVQVRFVYEVKASDLPEKLEFILSSIKRTGGRVDMEVPNAQDSNTPSWSFTSAMDRVYTRLERFFNNMTRASTGLIERAWKKPFESIDSRNARVVFGTNKKGEVIITGVNFTLRAKP
jgi:hypothetical protein